MWTSRAPTEQLSHEDQTAKQEIINKVNSVVQTMPGTNKKLNDIVTSPDMIKNFWTIARSYAEGMGHVPSKTALNLLHHILKADMT